MKWKVKTASHACVNSCIKLFVYNHTFGFYGGACISGNLTANHHYQLLSVAEKYCHSRVTRCEDIFNKNTWVINCFVCNWIHDCTGARESCSLYRLQGSSVGLLSRDICLSMHSILVFVQLFWWDTNIFIWIFHCPLLDEHGPQVLTKKYIVWLVTTWEYCTKIDMNASNFTLYSTFSLHVCN